MFLFCLFLYLIIYTCNSVTNIVGECFLRFAEEGDEGVRTVELKGSAHELEPTVQRKGYARLSGMR